MMLNARYFNIRGGGMKTDSNGFANCTPNTAGYTCILCPILYFPLVPGVPKEQDAQDCYLRPEAQYRRSGGGRSLGTGYMALAML